jgi:hypothetical protein
LPLPPPKDALQAEHSPALRTPVVTTLANTPFPTASHPRGYFDINGNYFPFEKSVLPKIQQLP